MNIPESDCCKNCFYCAKLIHFGDKKNYQLVCTLFSRKTMSDEPYVCYTEGNSYCEMFTQKNYKIMNQAKYIHYKNKKEYIVLCYGFLESDLTQMVVYQSVLDKQVWIRPVDDFKTKFTLVDKL